MQELNNLEAAFLEFINWNLFVEHNFFNKYKLFLSKYCLTKNLTNNNKK